MIPTTIAILGAGNMGASLLGGLVANHYSPENIFISDTDIDKLKRLEETFNIQTTTDNLAAIASADVVILAVKPQIILQVAHEIAATVQHKKPLILSIAAGIRIPRLQKIIGDHIPIVRCMPNTPALIGCGASALFANDFVSDIQRNTAESILRAVGIALWVDGENDLDVVTALSGSGPAYFFKVMEAMQKAGEKLGLSAESAKLLTLQTALGASRMALESNLSVVQLRKNVTSPGGTTEKAIQVLEENGMDDLFEKALTAAKERSEELANS